MIQIELVTDAHSTMVGSAGPYTTYLKCISCEDLRDGGLMRSRLFGRLILQEASFWAVTVNIVHDFVLIIH